MEACGRLRTSALKEAGVIPKAFDHIFPPSIVQNLALDECKLADVKRSDLIDAVDSQMMSSWLAVA